ncbi:MAG: dephospho-CoA kinase [Planctomycetes bacterium GWF2_41_51]|nr:MAG: dephospho-CoA kinase [Planctomycetes bacterium GWF2_41_51]
MDKKPVIGLLGGIASGKSTVAAQFEAMGAAVIDADRIAKELLHNPQVKQQIRNTFGGSVFDSAGDIDKQKLSAAVFDNPSSVKAINSIIHPRVMEKTELLIEQYQADAGIIAVVLDIPLLMEVGWEKRCDKLVFVDCDENIRLKRASKRQFFNENLLKKREKFQISLDNKKKISHYIINNNDDLSELTKQISEIFPALISKK